MKIKKGAVLTQVAMLVRYMLLISLSYLPTILLELMAI